MLNRNTPNYPETRRILITGAAGFLGSHLAERILDDGNGLDVIGVDNLYSGSKYNIAHLRDDRRFEFIRHDVTLPLYMEIDEIYNLACPASPGSLPVRPGSNGEDIRSRRHQHARTGETDQGPDPAGIDQRGLRRPENLIRKANAYWGNVNPIGPRACYDEGKRCAETLFFDYQRQHGVDIRVVRIFNTYGPRMHPQRWPRRFEFHSPGPAEPANHDLRRRIPNPQLLLCG